MNEMRDRKIYLINFISREILYIAITRVPVRLFDSLSIRRYVNEGHKYQSIWCQQSSGCATNNNNAASMTTMKVWIRHGHPSQLTPQDARRKRKRSARVMCEVATKGGTTRCQQHHCWVGCNKRKENERRNTPWTSTTVGTATTMERSGHCNHQFFCW